MRPAQPHRKEIVSKVKRGWITWDRTELPRAAFDARLEKARTLLTERDLAALVVYTDIWRSNRVRHFSNFMPYWNRAFLVIPREASPVLLCGLSPRVYPWIKSVTILDEILPSPNLPQRLQQLCGERNWTRTGALDLRGFPNDLYSPLKQAGIEDLSLPDVPDDAELSMHRHAAKMAREGLAEEVSRSGGQLDHEFTGRLERKLRRAGAEDLVILLSNGLAPPALAHGEKLGASYSVALALEYRGHWVKLVRNAMNGASERPSNAHTENLSGPYPFETGDGPIFAARWEMADKGRRLFYGDTYLRTDKGAELL
jgi:hypothetical protein